MTTEIERFRAAPDRNRSFLREQAFLEWEMLVHNTLYIGVGLADDKKQVKKYKQCVKRHRKELAKTLGWKIKRVKRAMEGKATLRDLSDLAWAMGKELTVILLSPPELESVNLSPPEHTSEVEAKDFGLDPAHRG